MNAIPLSLKRAIGAGIGLFILFIGFFNGGLIVSTGLTSADGPALASVFPTARPVRVPVRPPVHRRPVGAPDPGRAGHLDPRHDDRRPRRRRRDGARRRSSWRPDLHDARRVRPDERLHARPADGAPGDLLDHARRLLRHDGHGHRRRQPGRARPRGRLGARHRARAPRRQSSRRPSAASVVCRRTRRYIESAAGVAEGARTGFASVVTGVLFLLAILLAPLAGIIPGVGDRAGPRARRLPDVYAGSRHQGRRVRGRIPGPARRSSSCR